MTCPLKPGDTVRWKDTDFTGIVLKIDDTDPGGKRAIVSLDRHSIRLDRLEKVKGAKDE